MSALFNRTLIISSAFLVFAATAVFASGEYQKTKDGKTSVWNSAPKPGDTASWVGDRDREGYANGFGTLTWYTGKGNVFGRYYGNMVRGKFDGAVNVHTKGKTAHAFFIDGTRTSRWAMGAAPSRRLPPEQRAERKERTASTQPPKDKKESITAMTPKTETPAATPAKPPVVAKAEPTKAPEPAPQPVATPSPPEPTATPPPVVAEATPETEAIASQPANPETPAEAPPASTPPSPSPSKKSAAEVEASLQSLVRPPSVLHDNPETVGSSPAASSSSAGTEARLTREEVIETADALARKRGYDPADYERAEPQYNSTDGVWSLTYEQKPAGASDEPPRRFGVTIDDHTKGTVFVPPK